MTEWPLANPLRFVFVTRQSTAVFILRLMGRTAALRHAPTQVWLTARQTENRFCFLKTVPGIGQTLALTIMLETGDIGRFADVGNYASYCRCVGSQKISNGKNKGRAIPRTAISICPGRLSKRPTSPSGSVPGSRVFIRERKPRAMAWLGSEQWPTSCAGLIITS